MMLEKSICFFFKKAARGGSFFCLTFLFVFLFTGQVASAYRIIDTDQELKGDFVLSPAKIEVTIDPGETATRTLSFMNRTNQSVTFGIGVEDFRGSMNTDQAIILLGEETGPYSLKDFVHTEVDRFTLKPAQRIILPVTISIPENAEPGGLYGSVLIKNIPEENEEVSGAQAISRLGALFFVKVSGDVEESGSLRDFRLAGGGRFHTGGPFDFEFIYENTGNVHVVPYGRITISNTLGNPVQEIEIPAYFALPDAVRYRKIAWNSEFLLGRYTAVLELNRGYGDIIDTRKVVFWVVPWKWIVGGFLGIFIILLLGYLTATKLEIRVKKK